LGFCHSFVIKTFVIRHFLDTQDRHLHARLMNSLNRFADPFYCATRLIVGLMFASHGGQLVLGMFGGMPGSGNLMMQVGGWIQLVGGLLIAFGLLTRLAAFISSGEMAVAYFMIHVANAPTPMAKFFPISSAGPQVSNKGELAIFYCWFFLFVVFYGAGHWSIDALMSKRNAAGAMPST
jgi:putative oxidoreductase